MSTPIEMLAMLDKYEASETAREERKREQRLAETKALLEKIKTRAKEIGEILPVVRKLIKNGIGKYDYMYNKFLTDGVSHRLGFVREMPNLFGREAGGACGSTDCYFDWSNCKFSIDKNGTSYSVNDFAKKFSETYWVYETVKKMAEGGIDIYIASVSKAVEDLCR